MTAEPVETKRLWNCPWVHPYPLTQNGRHQPPQFEDRILWVFFLYHPLKLLGKMDQIWNGP